MNDEDIRAAMHSLDTKLPAGSLDPRQVASRAVKRHQWQMRSLTGVAIFLWLFAAAGVLYVVYGALWHLYPRQKLLMHDIALGKIPADKIDALQATHFMVIEAATIVLAVSFIASTLAALCTVRLVLVSRRATLTQINQQLAGISEQLRPPPVTAARQS
jgi:hypothetical protein